jgi:hypothetical protein
MAPLFILTCMRSYSSLVSSMLGQHSGLYCLPEVNPFIGDTLGAGVDLLNMVRKRTLDGLYRAVAELEFGGQTEETIAAAQAWVRQRRGWSAVALMEHFAGRVAPKRLIEKSPSTVLNPERLNQALALFPQAHFLHLYRHPVSTTASIAKITLAAQGPRARNTRDPEVSWFGVNRAILKLSTRIPLGQFMSVRGEDVLDDPDKYLGQICQWLGLTSSPQDFADMRQPENSPYAHLGPPSATFGNDPGFLKHPRYAKRDIDLPPLDSALDWAEGRRLRPETVDLSYQLGYA